VSHEHTWNRAHPNSNRFSVCECGAQVASIHRSGADYLHFYTGDHVTFKGKPLDGPKQKLSGTIKRFTTRWVGTNKHGSSRRQAVFAWIDSPGGRGTFSVQLGKFEHAEAIDALGALVEDQETDAR
jgi:hypothetical protein